MNNAAAYCRVSTDKTDQLNSLETQKAFFTEYARKEGVNLVRIYADEGISGTKVTERISKTYGGRQKRGVRYGFG